MGVVEHAGLAPQPAQKSARKNEEVGAIAGDGKSARLSKQSPSERRDDNLRGRLCRLGLRPAIGGVYRRFLREGGK